MRITALTGLFAVGLIFALSGAKASAQTPTGKDEPTTIIDLLTTNREEPVLLAVIDSEEPVRVPEEAQTAPVNPEHAVQSGESLSDIAKQYNTTWRRLYDKNTAIENPDIIHVGTKIIIPFENEQIAERALPVIAAPVVASAPARTVKRTSQATSSVSNRTAAPAQQTTASSNGNRYTAGYCTWYVKNRRPDLPNNLGNAQTWVSRAAAQGLPTGSTPAVGAVGQQGNHVVYVESVNADGTVTISEMNQKGLYVTSSRTVPASYFSYIY